MNRGAASFRMYEAAPGAAAAWRALFAAAFEAAGVDVAIVEHRWPEPIAALWARPDLFGAFMCGWPWSRGAPRLRAIAAPVPSPARYEGLPRYCSDFVARAGDGIGRLEDAFGRRFGWMARDSQSGFNAPRAHLAGFFSGEALFAEVKGPLGAPATTLEALRANEVDLVALDGFWLDLLRHHAPERLEGLVVVDSTPWTPIPLVVAAPGADADAAACLRSTLLAAHEDPRLAPLLAPALLSRFAVPDPEAYGVFAGLEAEAVTRGYEEIG